nr:copper chaperone PCu(A)C [Sphingomonas gellani]
MPAKGSIGGAAAALALMLGACSAPPKLSVDNAWVRLSAVPNGPAAAYFTLHGGRTDATLISVSADVAVRSEMHESMTGARGMSGMHPLDRVVVPAEGDVAFAPGGRHVMLFNVNPGIRPGGHRVLLTLTFADGRRLQRNATVLGAGDEAAE